MSPENDFPGIERIHPLDMPEHREKPQCPEKTVRARHFTGISGRLTMSSYDTSIVFSGRFWIPPALKKTREAVSQGKCASLKTIDMIISVLRSHPEVEKAVLYGSRAKGNYKEGSDIDLTLFGDISFTLLGAIFDELDDLLLPYSFDLSAYANIENESLKDHIRRIGKILYKRT